MAEQRGPAELPRIIAHRGASRAAPENTLAAFRAAADAGARAVEFDVSLLGDGTAVLHHDATLDRCTDASGPLRDIGRDDLPGIDAGGWFAPAFRGERIATLDAALACLAGLGLAANLEMKPHGADPGPLARAVAAALAAHRGPPVVVSSFEAGALAALGRLSGCPLAMLWEAPPDDWPERLAALGAGALHVEHRAADAALLAQAVAAGVALRVYTLNDPRAAHLRRPGLAGVITDDPRLFLDDPGWAAWAA